MSGESRSMSGVACRNSGHETRRHAASRGGGTAKMKLQIQTAAERRGRGRSSRPNRQGGPFFGLLLLLLLQPQHAAGEEMPTLSSSRSSQSSTSIVGGCFGDRHVTCDALTHYECGRQIGAKQRTRVQAAIASPHARALVAWAATSQGNTTLSRYLAMHARELPDLLEEVRGMADGADVKFYPDLFSLNMDVEISSKFLPASADLAPFSKGCSDVHLIVPEHKVQGWGHNEDGEISDLNDFYFVTANISGFRYFAMCYAGRLCGWTYGWNSHGVVHSVNALYTLKETPMGLGTNFMAREMLRASSVANAVQRAQRGSQDGGSHFNIGSIYAACDKDDPCQVSIETSWEGATVLNLGHEPLQSSFYSHFNAYLHTDKPAAGDYTSSIYRLARATTMASRPAAADAAPLMLPQVLDMLGDNFTYPYCLHRCNTKEDPYITITTSLIDLVSRRIQVYTSQTSSEKVDEAWLDVSLDGGFDFFVPPFPERSLK